MSTDLDPTISLAFAALQAMKFTISSFKRTLQKLESEEISSIRAGP